MYEKSCKHFTSPVHNTSCKAGVNYLELAGGIRQGYLRRIPCSGMPATGKQTLCECPQRENYTPEEAKAIMDELIERSDLMVKALQQIRDFEKLTGKIKRYLKTNGSIECPKCKGSLNYHYVKPKNHMRAQCETEGCLRWFE